MFPKAPWNLKANPRGYQTVEWPSFQYTFEFVLVMQDLRAKRDRLIAETDYLALSDQTLSAEMSTYRQALRDITNGITTVTQANNVTWPTKP